MKSWLMVLLVLSMILAGRESSMAQSKKPVTKNGRVVSMENVPWDDKGRELMKKGNRTSVGNTTEGGDTPSMDFLMHAMNINLQERKDNQSKKKKKPKNIDIRSREERLRGIFGGKR